ncbi:DUF5050 domain-containing protein [Paenibacillus sp. FSL W8-0194]|uniref:DUF5050 domain-containing protein n=1 Tax=Paenibacillus sp. FSL W8-0194 TaxID=2921711 RepID=UPI0030D9F03D
MRKTIFIIALFLLVNMNVTFAGSNQNSSFAGNSTGNLNNDGFYASKGEWIYYRSFSSAGGLYKVKKDGTEKTKLMDGFPGYINIVGDYLYYSDGWKLTKAKIDGTEKQVLANSAFHVNVTDQYIFYTNIGPQDGFIYRMNLDGTGKIQLNNDHASQIVVSGKSLYYTSYYNKLIKIDIHGNSKVKLLEGKLINELNIEGDWLYFNYDQKLYKMKTDGTKLTMLSSDNARYINVSDGWIYYSDHSKKKNLVRIKTDGTERQELNQIKSFYIHLIDHYVFFHDLSKMVKVDIHDMVKDERKIN